MTCGGLPFPGTGCPAPGVGNIYLVWHDLCIGYCFCISASQGCFCPQKVFSKNWLDRLTRTSFIIYLYTKLTIISKGVPGLATDSPCGVWGRGWTTCLLYDDPLLGFRFWINVGGYAWYSGEELCIDLLHYPCFYTLPKFFLAFSSQIILLWNSHNLLNTMHFVY